MAIRLAIWAPLSAVAWMSAASASWAGSTTVSVGVGAVGAGAGAGVVTTAGVDGRRGLGSVGVGLGERDDGDLVEILDGPEVVYGNPMLVGGGRVDRVLATREADFIL